MVSSPAECYFVRAMPDSFMISKRSVQPAYGGISGVQNTFLKV